MHPEGLRHLICVHAAGSTRSPWFWLLLLLAGLAVWVVLGLLGFIWTAIYDTLQEGDQPPPP